MWPCFDSFMVMHCNCIFLFFVLRDFTCKLGRFSCLCRVLQSSAPSLVIFLKLLLTMFNLVVSVYISPCDSASVCQSEGILPWQLARFPEHVLGNSQGYTLFLSYVK